MRPASSGSVSSLIVLGCLVTLLAGCAAGSFRLRPSPETTLLAAADRLGYEPLSKIAQVERCWDIFAHCGHQLSYATDLTQVELADKLDGLGWNLTNHMPIDGYEIFTKLNLGTRARITIAGSEGLDERDRLPRFKGYRWRLTDPEGRLWTVDHYPLADQIGPFAIDGRPFADNIVQIMLQTR